MQGARQPLQVRFAETDKEKQMKKAGMNPGGMGMGMPFTGQALLANPLASILAYQQLQQLQGGFPGAAMSVCCVACCGRDD